MSEWVDGGIMFEEIEAWEFCLKWHVASSHSQKQFTCSVSTEEDPSWKWLGTCLYFQARRDGELGEVLKVFAVGY